MRSAYFDNSRAILIFLVVLGHFIIWKGAVGEDALWLIYSFHMPVFIFISGFFSKKESWAETCKKSIIQFLIPYVFFQSLYNYATYFWLDKPISTDYSIANFTLWFLLAMIFWKIFLQVVIRWKWTLLLFFLLYLSHRFFIADLRYVSIGRILNFFPFFVLGYFFKIHGDMLLNKIKKLVDKPFLMKTIGLVGMSSLFFLYKSEMINIPISWFYGFFYPMDSLTDEFSVSYLMLYQLYVTGFSFLMGLFFLMIIPTKNYSWTHIGQFTLTIYLLHGFVRHWLVKEELLFAHHSLGDLLAVSAFSLLITYILSRQPFNHFVSLISTLFSAKKEK